VFDEWLWADLSGENGEQAECEALRLLEAVFARCDQLVTVYGSAFLEKFYGLAVRAVTGDRRRQVVRVFKSQFLENGEKLRILQEGDLPEIPPEVGHNVKEEDRYLVRAYVAGRADLLVTTDRPLMEVLSGSRIRCRERGAFMSSYLGGGALGEE